MEVTDSGVLVPRVPNRSPIVVDKSEKREAVKIRVVRPTFEVGLQLRANEAQDFLQNYPKEFLDFPPETSSVNPVVLEVLRDQVRRETERDGYSSSYWKWVSQIGDPNEFWQVYEKRLSVKLKQKSSSGEYTEVTNKVFGKFMESDLPSYLKMVKRGLELRKELKPESLKEDDASKEAFEGSLVTLGRAHPVEAMLFIRENKAIIRPGLRSDILRAVLESDPQEGMKLAKKMLGGLDIKERIAAYYFIENEAINRIKHGQDLTEYINLYEQALNEYVSNVTTEPYAAQNRTHLPLFQADVYEAACLVQGHSSVLTPILTSNHPEGEFAKRYIQFETMGKVDPSGILLRAGRVDLFIEKFPATSAFTTEGKSITYKLHELLHLDTTRPEQAEKIRKRLSEMIDIGFASEDISKTSLSKILQANNSGDLARQVAELNVLWLPNSLILSGEDVLAEQVIKKLLDGGIASPRALYESMSSSMEKLVQRNPDLFLLITKDIDILSSKPMFNSMELLRSEAEWRNQFMQHPEEAWNKAKQLLTKDADWINVVGILHASPIITQNNPENLDYLLADLFPKASELFADKFSVYQNAKNLPSYTNSIGANIQNLMKTSFAENIAVLPIDKRIEYIKKLSKMESFVEVPFSLQSFSWELATGNIDKDKLLELIAGLGNDSTISSFQLPLLKKLASMDSGYVLRYCIDKKGSTDFVNKSLHKLVIECLSQQKPSLEEKRFYANVSKHADKLSFPGQLGFVTEVVGLAPSSVDNLLTSYETLKIRLQTVFEKMEESKKVSSVDQFLTRYQVQIAKMFLIYPEPGVAVSLITDTLKQHGFARVSERLTLMDQFLSNDIIKFYEVFSKRGKGEVNQGLMGDLLSIFSTYSAANRKELFFEKFSEHVNSPRLLVEMSKNLLVEFGKSLGINIDGISEDKLKLWDFKYLPKLFEASLKFNETDKLILATIIKSSMLGDFASVIDPRGEFDAVNYSPEELNVIKHIRIHNKITDERYVSHNLDINIFAKGGEAHIKGVVQASEAIAQAKNRILSQLNQNIKEAERFVVAPDIVKVHKSLSEFEKTCNDLVEFLVTHEKENDAQPDKPDLSTVEFILKTALGSGKDSVNSLLRQDVASSIRGSNFLRPFKWKDGALVALPTDGQTLRTRLQQLDSELRNELYADPSKEDRIVDIRNRIAVTLDMLVNPPKAKIAERPSLQNELIASVDLLMAAISIKSDDGSLDPQVKVAINLLQDHLSSRKKELQELVELGKNVESRDYNLTIRRWKRNPGHDAFQGNYSSCCVAIEGQNGFEMTRMLMGKEIELTEIIDESTQQTVGQSFEFIAETRDGQSVYVIDNVELSPGMAMASDKIRDELLRLATETAAKMSQDSSLPGISQVVMGTSYNDVNISDLERQTGLVMRKLGGPALGLRQYLDVFVTHETQDEGRVLNPNAFHPTRLALVPFTPVIAGVSTEVPDQAFTTETSTNWNEIKEDIVRLEDESFGLTGDTEKTLEAKFTNPANIVIVAKDFTGKIVGYTVGLDNDIEEFGEVKGKSLYVDSTAVDANYQSLGVNAQLQERLESEAKAKGFELLNRHAMADTGYAQRIIRRAIKRGNLVYPSSLESAETIQFYGRPQMLVVTELK